VLKSVDCSVVKLQLVVINICVFIKLRMRDVHGSVIDRGAVEVDTLASYYMEVEWESCSVLYQRIRLRW